MSLDDLFKTEVMRWRYAGALAVVMTLQAILPRLLCSAFSSAIVDQVWSPIALTQRLWIGPWLQGLFWPSVCFLVLTRLHVHQYKVYSSHPCRVWESLRAVVRLQTLALACAVCTCVCALVTLYAAAAHNGCASILQPCHTSDGAQVCINSRALVVLCLGLYLGCRHSANYTLANGNLVTMATVTVPRGRRLRSLLLRPHALLKRAVGAVLGGDSGRGLEDGGVAVVRVGVKSVAGVLLTYALLGGLLDQWVASALGAPVHLSSPSSSSDQHLLLDSVAAMLHSSGDASTPSQQAATNLHSDTPPVVGILEQSFQVQHNDSHTPGTGTSSDLQGMSWLSMVLSWHRLHVLVDPTLVVVMVFTMMVVTVLLELFYEVFAVFTLQPIQLPPSPTAPDGSNNPWSLPSALQSDNPTLRLLACHQLAQLGVAGGDRGRTVRAPVFEISSPGGHPRNLKAILTPTLDLINKFTERLMKQNCPEEYTAFIAANATACPSTAAVDGSFNSSSLLTGPSGALANNTTILGNTSAYGSGNIILGNTSVHGGGGNISLLGTSSAGLYGNTSVLNTNTCHFAATSQPTVVPEVKTSLAANLKKKLLDKLIEKATAARRLPVIRWLLAELPDAANRQIFAEAQPILWAVQGLSGLVCASLTEDQFGVVQRHLPAIMTALLQLNVAVDKSGRAPLPKRLPSGGLYGGVGVVGGGAAPHHTRLRRGLRLSLRTALYTITDTFKDRITEAPLAPSLRNKMQSYLELMEG